MIRESGSTLGNSGINSLFVNGNGVVGSASTFRPHLPAALKKGAEIGPHQSFIPHRYKESTMAWVFQTDPFGLHYYGKWIKVSDRYLGLRFQIAGNTYYGWARLSVREQGRKITATLTGYAYETIPSKAIIAGQTKGPDDGSIEASNSAVAPPTSRPATLGRLALGRK